MTRFGSLALFLAGFMLVGLPAAQAEDTTQGGQTRDGWAAGQPAVQIPDEYAALRGTLETCFGCHGPNGASTDPEVPILAGQHPYYLYVQLKDFKAGLRGESVMKEIAKGLEKDQMKALAKFFSEQQWPRSPFQADPAKARQGSTAADAGMCVQCHLGGFEGDSRVPRLAGQYSEYLRKSMLDFKTKARNNAAAKSALMEAFNEADIDAMAEYLAGL